MPNLCAGDNGKKNTSEIGIGHIAMYVVQLETQAFNITQRQKVRGLQPPGSGVPSIISLVVG